ncbi:MAG: hypothetical protein WBX10_09280 [Candidatus Sulfotelmatobacter sp.]
MQNESKDCAVRAASATVESGSAQMRTGPEKDEQSVSSRDPFRRIELSDTKISWSDDAMSRAPNPTIEGDSFRRNAMNSALLDFYLCPEHFVNFEFAGKLSDEAGYFRCGQNATCFGRSVSGYRRNRPDVPLYDTLADIGLHNGEPVLPFDPTEVIDNLRLERYANPDGRGLWSGCERRLKEIYYLLRPFMGVSVRRQFQRARLMGWRKVSFPHWPVDTTVEDLCERLLLISMKAKGLEKIPFVWFWPDGAQSCAVMTHDVETEKGRDFCSALMDLDDSFGIKASFQIVPEGRYEVSDTFIRVIRDRGFEVNLQDLNHDGNLFRKRSEFRRRAERINQYGARHAISGFRSAVLYRNLDWYDALQFSFDMSVPNVAHLDPQKGGCCTVMPYFFGNTLEIPVTTTQDYMLFHLLNDYSLDLWKEQVDLIVARSGLASFIVHPDYVIEEKARNTYRQLLAFLRETGRQKKMWFALPSQIDEWWRARRGMRIVGEEGNWRVVGKGAERAKVAMARIAGDRLQYALES